MLESACDGETIVLKREDSVTSERMVGERWSCNEILLHWIHGAVSGVERPSLLKFLILTLQHRCENDL